MSRQILIDTVITIDDEFIAKIDERVTNDKDLSETEKRLWIKDRLYPESYTKELGEHINNL